jgi:galactonate dehydratase
VTARTGPSAPPPYGSAVTPAEVPAIAGISLIQVGVSAKTIWLFVQVVDAAGKVGIGEATLQKQEVTVARALGQIAPTLLGQPAHAQALGAIALAGLGMAHAAAYSALDHALWDLAGQRDEVPVAQLLGADVHEIGLYANVNRGLASREPEAFAAAVRAAVDAGFRAVKIAPFDEIDTHGRWGVAIAPTRAALERGLARIAAARAAVGATADLMIDCHWRFDEPWAERVIDAVGPMQLHWVECPLPETEAHFAALVRLRARANRLGMLLAGGEDGVGRDAFRPFLAAGTYDVLMPDIKYVGGFDELRAVAALAARHGVAIAPHNPSGPVAHAASVHACAALEGFTRLELQWNESPLFDTVVAPPVPRPHAGTVRVSDQPGLGIALASDAAGATVSRDDWGVRL